MAIKDVFRGVAQSTRKRFYDDFDRANQSGLGTAKDGSIWNTLRGSFSISSNTAVGVDANYPIANQTMPFSNVEIDLYGTTQGSAASLWVTDSGNWWAVGMTQEPESCNCTYYYNTNYYYADQLAVGQNATTGYSVCNQSSCNAASSYCAGNYNGQNCNNFACNGYTCNAYNAYNSKNKTGGTCAASSCAGYRCSGSYNASNCNSLGYICYGGYTCNVSQSLYTPGNYYYYYYAVLHSSTSGPYASCSTCYPQYIRVIQSVANTVSVVTQWSIGTLASALKIKTSGSQITVSAYSDSSMITQIGSDLVYTPTGVAITPAFGLTVIPSTYNQGYTTDAIEIKTN
jgi:hypothetical protein